MNPAGSLTPGIYGYIGLQNQKEQKRPFDHCSVEYTGDLEISFELNIGIIWK